MAERASSDLRRELRRYSARRLTTERSSSIPLPQPSPATRMQLWRAARCAPAITRRWPTRSARCARQRWTPARRSISARRRWRPSMISRAQALSYWAPRASHRRSSQRSSAIWRLFLQRVRRRHRRRARGMVRPAGARRRKDHAHRRQHLYRRLDNPAQPDRAARRRRRDGQPRRQCVLHLDHRADFADARASRLRPIGYLRLCRKDQRARRRRADRLRRVAADRRQHLHGDNDGLGGNADRQRLDHVVLADARIRGRRSADRAWSAASSRRPARRWRPVR